MDLQIALESVERYFFDDLGGSTTAYLYGSAATGDWSKARSDIDLLFLIKTDQFDAFKTQLTEWKRLGSPLLDGYICAEDSVDLQALRLDLVFLERADSPAPFLRRILPPDLWKIQNRSKKLFGRSGLVDSFPRVTRSELQNWAIRNRDEYWIPEIQNGIASLSKVDPRKDTTLTGNIWVVSGAARIFNLINGGLPISKHEALKLFVRAQPKGEELVDILIRNYEMNDDAITISTAHALELAEMSLRLLCSSRNEPT